MADPGFLKQGTIQESKVQKSIGAQTKVKLHIPQLALAKLAQLGRHPTRTKEVRCSIPTAFLLNLDQFCFSPT